MLAHLRTEAYPLYGLHVYPPEPGGAATLSFEENVRRIDRARQVANSGARQLKR
jgi:hypothetical protein